MTSHSKIVQFSYSTLHALQFLFKTILIDDSWIVLDLSQSIFELCEFFAMLVHSFLHEIVTSWTIYTAILTIVFVLFASIASSSFDIWKTLELNVLSGKRHIDQIIGN